MKQKLLKPTCSLHTSKPYTFCHTTIFHCMTVHHLNVIFLKGANIAHHLLVRSVGSCLCFMKYPPISLVFLPQKTAFPIFM